MASINHQSDQDGPLNEPDLRFVHGGFNGIHRLKGLLGEGLPELALDFSPERFMAFYDDFREREAAVDRESAENLAPAFYWIAGENCWIRVCFQPNESYYSWGCYALEDRVMHFKTYFAGKGL